MESKRQQSHWDLLYNRSGMVFWLPKNPTQTLPLYSLIPFTVPPGSRNSDYHSLLPLVVTAAPYSTSYAVKAAPIRYTHHSQQAPSHTR